jgi:imidazolonepropionase-like amidohydrolase
MKQASPNVLLIMIGLAWMVNAAAIENKPLESNEPESTIMYAGTLLAVPGTKPKTEQTILIEQGKIVSIHDGYQSAEQLELDADLVQIIDLKENFVLPGLIDAHVHLMLKHTGKFKDPLRTGEEELMTGIVNARITLKAGFTTVADLEAGADAWPAFVLRNAIRKGEVPGPNLLLAGSSISPTAGHADLLNVPDQLAESYPASGLCDGADACRRAVRRQFRQGADLIKVMATGGGSERTGGKFDAPSFLPDEFAAIVATAHGLNLKVTAHAHSTAGINMALAAGVDSIEHGSFMDDESVSLFKQTGAYLLPTLDVQDMIGNLIDSVPEPMKSRMALFQKDHPASVKMAHQAGVKMALGSDAGIVPHGSNARELEWLVKVGISEEEVIKIATINTAEHLGLSAQVGRLEDGLNADVIAVSGNPLEDITVFQKMAFVMKGGHVFLSSE